MNIDLPLINTKQELCYIPGSEECSVPLRSVIEW